MKSRVIVVTGTPGTGKTSLCRYIVNRNKDWIHLDLGRFAAEANAITGYDYSLETGIVDMSILKKALRKHVSNSVEEGVRLLIDGHYAAEVSPAEYVNYCLVLRCRPDVLWRRLRSVKGYGEEKARRNVESEITDYCYLMAKLHFKRKRIVQLDTTGVSVGKTYIRFMECYREGFRCKGDVVDWVDFLLRNPGKMSFLFR
ncbi:MAG: AAA family ATPase [Thaumarchaeota archaeon]|nr:AAA family ATPase [Nitrososphaerota archaeon]